MSKQQKKSLTLLSAAVGLALSCGMHSAIAGEIKDTNPSSTGVPLGACGGDGSSDTEACVGAWNLTNVQVNLIRLADGSTFGSFNPTTGIYSTMTVGDSFVSNIYDDSVHTTLMAKLSGKVWPVGEPTGIKAVNNDGAVQNGKPINCLINSSYLENFYLDVQASEPVICSSPFQSHKRFKVAMQPATTTSVTSGDGQPIDLVFNTTDNGSKTPYQVFSKINNYTGKRLSGYKIEIGTGGAGTGQPFQTASSLGISDQLYLSLGINENTTDPQSPLDLFEFDGLATFSHGLFGAADGKHFFSDGFFSNKTAYYPVVASCATVLACPATAAGQAASDTIYSDVPLSSNYTHLFGEWLPSDWAPKGIFFDNDSDPTTDPELVAWWSGTQWLMQSKDASGKPIYDANGYAVFVPVTQAEFNVWASDSRYSIDVIEDVLNLGINYIVHVGDINGAPANSTTFTVRIIPVVAVDQTAPAWVGTTPAPLVVTPITTTPPTTTTPPATTTPTTTTSSSGGGCTVGGDGRFDPIFPALLLAGLGFLGLRRFSRKS